MAIDGPNTPCRVGAAGRVVTLLPEGRWALNVTQPLRIGLPSDSTVKWTANRASLS
jgi:hypothetical protein